MVAGGVAAQTDGVSLRSVTLRTLDVGAGSTVQPPSRGPGVPLRTAERMAITAYPGSRVREAALANVTARYVVPEYQGLAWIVSLTRTDGIWSASGMRGRSPVKLSYQVVIVDASTGAFIVSARGEAVPG